MLDAEFKAQVKRIQALIKRWVKPMGLNRWRIEFQYCREPIEQNGGEQLLNCETITMETTSQWCYQQALVRVDIHSIATMEDDLLEWVFVHEMCHIYLAEMDAKGKSAIQHEEHAASELATAFIWIRQAGENEGKKLWQARERQLTI